MRFSKPSAQHIVSVDGFEILPAGRHALIYKELDKEMEVSIEFGRSTSGRACITVWPGAFARWHTDSPIIAMEEQKRIERNFRSAMDFDGFDLLVWDPRTEEYLETAAHHGRLIVS
jgi:hypothetical protein